MNEIVAIPHERPLDAYRMSTDAAGVCGAIVKQTAKPIQGRKYVSVEGWQAIAIAHGCAASADNVERVNDEGMSGFKALGIVRRMSDGQEIARAEGFLGDDEGMWAKRTVHARRAMVQTRAISRACRSAFAHVVVMIDAGLSTTPAEEMGGETVDAETGEIVTGEAIPTGKVQGITKIKERLGKLLKAGNAATDLEAFNRLVHDGADDLTKIKDAQHGWWTGDGDDFEGFKTWIKRRRAELAPKDEATLGFQMLLSALEQCATRNDLTALLDEHGAVAEALDGEESRRWEEAYNAQEAAIMAVAPVSAG